MFSTLISVILFASVAFKGVSAELEIGDLTLTQCQPATIGWAPSAAGAPYTLLVVPASNPCDEPLVDIGDFTTTSTSWKVNVPAGQSVRVSVIDKNGEENWSNPATVQPGSDVSCLASSPSSAAPASSSPTKSASSTAVAAAAGTANIIGGAAAAGNPFAISDSAAIDGRQLSLPVAALAGLVAMFTLL